MSDTTYRLWCLVEGDTTRFPVVVSFISICVLKDLIKEKGVLNSVDAKYLTLWKVNLAPPSKDEWKHVTGKNVPGSVKLEGELDNISGPCNSIIKDSTDAAYMPAIKAVTVMAMAYDHAA